MDVTAEDAVAIMQAMTNGNQYVKDFYATLHERSEDLNASDYGAVVFSKGEVGLDGDQILTVSDKYLRNFSKNGDVLNVGYGSVQWNLTYVNENAAEPLEFLIKGRGDCFATLRPYGLGGYSDITLNNIDSSLNELWDRVTLRYRAEMVDTSGALPVTFYVLDSIVMRERGTGLTTVLTAGHNVYLANVTIAFRWVVPNTPSYMISALLGFDVDDVGVGQSSYADLWDTPHSTVEGVLAGYRVVEDTIASGIAAGRDEWYNQGLSDGLNQPDVWWSFFLRLLDSPMVLVGSMLNFEIFGINVFHLFRFILTCIVLVFLVAVVTVLGVKIGGLIT